MLEHIPDVILYPAVMLAFLAAAWVDAALGWAVPGLRAR
jgi:hypothetical protein